MRVWLVTFRLGTGKSLTFFYSVATCVVNVSLDIKVAVNTKEVQLQLILRKICLKNVSL
jgi:hypothetical protein